jgi:predicted ATPase
MAMGYQLHRETQTACEHAKTALALAAEHGFTQVLAISTMVQGWAISVLGQTADGTAQVQEGLISAQTIGTKLARPYFLTLLTESHVRGGQVEEGLQILAEGLALVDTTGERWYEAELHRLKGELLLQQAIPDASQAETCFQQALDIVRRQQAKSLELRAATSLARLWQSQGKRQDAYDLLAPVYGWFTEGFDTADLQEAESLLDALRE